MRPALAVPGPDGRGVTRTAGRCTTLRAGARRAKDVCAGSMGRWVATWLLSLGIAAGPALAQQPADPPPADPTATAPKQPSPLREPLLRAVGRQVRMFLASAEQPLRGEVIEVGEDFVTLKIGPVLQSYALERIDRFEVQPTVDESFAQMRGLLSDRDTDQILELCLWAMREGREDLAIPQLQAVLVREPGHGRAGDMLRDAQARATLREREGVGRRPAPQPKPALPGASAEAVPALKADEINRIKVFELDIARRPRVEIAEGTIDLLIERYADTPEIPKTQEGRDALRRLAPLRQLDLIYRLRAREFYDRVRVLDDPEHLLDFRDRIHRAWLVNACASSECHGGSAAGRFQLRTQRPNHESTWYTNFYIITQYRMADGRPLLDHDQPADSPLLHLAMDRAQSKAAHPVVGAGPGGRDAWKPVIRSTEDRHFEQAVAFIERLYKPRPDYGISYEPAAPFEPPTATRPDEPAPPRPR